MANNQFRETRNLYSNFLQYTKPLSYVEWVSIPDDHKAAALFVQYFSQIELAWYKAKSFFTSEEDGVYTMMQYLMKNVDIIKKDSKRYTPSYIYRVAYNCLYCICHDPIIERIRYETTVSNIVTTNNQDEVDLFDTTISVHSDVEIQYEKKQLWETIDKLDPKSKKVVSNILSGSPLTKFNSRSIWAKDEEIKNVEVTIAEAEEIKERLAKMLAEFSDLM